MSHPLLGWIAPEHRTQAQHDADAQAKKRYVRFNLNAAVYPPRGTKVILTNLWSDPECVADMGQVFTGFRQLTGSCVGVSEGDAICTLSCVQRKFTESPTKAFIPFWPFPYGRTRYHEGDRGQGDGAVDSVMFKTLMDEGCFDIHQTGLPTFDTSDGLALSSRTELQYSDGASSVVTKWLTEGKKFPLGAAALLDDPVATAVAITNGFPVLDGVSQYCGNGSIRGSGDKAYVRGRYDGSGGHSTCLLGFWNHEDDGPLFLYSNQWGGGTYPKDPAGGGRCCVWLPESEVAKIWGRGLGGQGEIAALSHQTYFPAQPSVMDYFQFL